MKWLLTLLLVTSTAQATSSIRKVYVKNIDEIAIEYIQLSLAMTPHDSSFVDAYYGPAQFQENAQKTPLSLEDIKSKAKIMLAALNHQPAPEANSMQALRIAYLQKQTIAMLGRIDLLQGKKMSFDQESAVLYDTVAPHYDRQHFEAIIKQIDALLPGPGSTVERVNAFRSQFIIPRDKLMVVFETAIQACREQTLKHISLPEGENFKLEFVTGKVWSGYNWYKGKYQSLIQINVELPIYIERAIDIGCHEGYPGHHTYNVLLEKNLVNERKWLEYSVYPLFSPQSLIAEGSANYGVEMAFPAALKKSFQRDVLYPLAGINPALLDKYDALLQLTSQLSYAGNEAARNYLDGKMSREQAIQWLIDVELYPVEKAPQRISFYDANRSYVINYNVGKDLVKDYVEYSSRNASTEPAKTDLRWQVFEQLLSTPLLPSNLKVVSKPEK
ncbi:MAG: hypothetical protein KA902_01500 [Arenimonas sp.]|nr:hypothetical protein [Arenimonas sp.]